MSSVSATSRSGTLASTSPPPAKYSTSPRATVAVRIATASESPPARSTWPIAPQYAPRGKRSSASMISIARSFGVPLMLPGGNVASRIARRSTSSRVVARTVDTRCESPA
nr:hypothetical protein [Sandaracinus amylolyticus]